MSEEQVRDVACRRCGGAMYREIQLSGSVLWLMSADTRGELEYDDDGSGDQYLPCPKCGAKHAMVPGPDCGGAPQLEFSHVKD